MCMDILSGDVFSCFEADGGWIRLESGGPMITDSFSAENASATFF